MREPRKKIPFTELPIRVFREVGGKGEYLALIEAGSMQFSFLADGALKSRQKAKTFAHEQTAKVLRTAKTQEAE